MDKPISEMTVEELEQLQKKIEEEKENRGLEGFVESLPVQPGAVAKVVSTARRELIASYQDEEHDKQYFFEGVMCDLFGEDIFTKLRRFDKR